MRNVWLAIGLILLVFFILELILSLFFHLRSINSADSLLKFESDKGPVIDFEKELQASSEMVWHPYDSWRRKPFSGNSINIDQNGIRKTWNSNLSSKPLTIFMFGGSTVWGEGVADHSTIPSLLSKKLADHNIHVETINYGESDYVSTQEVITLLLELQRGHLPDIVIFYDGANDVYSALKNRRSGFPVHAQDRRKESILFNQRNVYKDLYYQFTQGFVPQSATFQTMKRLVNGPSEEKGLNPKLINEILLAYMANTKAVRALSDSYKFDTLLYWKPTLQHSSKKENEIVANEILADLTEVIHKRNRAR